jgi:hypothetical protein
MTIPGPGQAVHLMTVFDVLRVKWDMHRKERRNVRELQLYTTDDLRDLYQSTHASAPIALRDGIVTRVQIVAEIRWRVFWSRFGYVLILFLSAVAAVAGVIAAAEGWK